jgi:hypothetical protein
VLSVKRNRQHDDAQVRFAFEQGIKRQVEDHHAPQASPADLGRSRDARIQGPSINGLLLVSGS